jgi:hypothetical protein
LSDILRFAPLGPFKVPFIKGKRRLDFDFARDAVFSSAESVAEQDMNIDIYSAIGCYVFCLKPSVRTYPYYVGQACKQTLYSRVFQTSDKPTKYNEILDECGYERGTAQIFLLPLLTRSGRLAKLGSNGRAINNAEHTLIGLARAANYDLWNVKHRTGMDSFTIDGAFNSDGKSKGSAKNFKEVLRLKERAVGI